MIYATAFVAALAVFSGSSVDAAVHNSAIRADGTRFTFYDGVWRSHRGAVAFCKSQGQELAEMYDADEVRFVRNFLYSTGVQENARVGITDVAHLGGSDRPERFAFESDVRDPDAFEMIAKSGFPWADGQPNDTGGSEACAELNYDLGYKLNDVPCSTGIRVLCRGLGNAELKKKKRVYPNPTTEFFLTEQPGTHVAVKEQCLSQGGELAVINSLEEQLAAEELALILQDYLHLGLENPFPTNDTMTTFESSGQKSTI